MLNKQLKDEISELFLYEIGDTIKVGNKDMIIGGYHIEIRAPSVGTKFVFQLLYSVYSPEDMASQAINRILIPGELNECFEAEHDFAFLAEGIKFWPGDNIYFKTPESEKKYGGKRYCVVNSMHLICCPGGVTTTVGILEFYSNGGAKVSMFSQDCFELAEELAEESE